MSCGRVVCSGCGKLKSSLPLLWEILMKFGAVLASLVQVWRLFTAAAAAAAGAAAPTLRLLVSSHQLLVLQLMIMPRCVLLQRLWLLLTAAASD
jgi:hypothetical protein